MTDPVFAAQPYTGIASFGRVPVAADATGFDVSILGIPYDGSVSYRSGTRSCPTGHFCRSAGSVRLCVSGKFGNSVTTRIFGTVCQVPSPILPLGADCCAR